jgi:hypothetical protein
LTRSPLPEITLTCGNGHPFTTRAAGGQTVRCKECGKSKHVPTDRPRTAKEAASYAAPRADDHQDQGQPADPEPDPSQELADRWQLETPWSGSIAITKTRTIECPECGGPLSWEPRRTLVYCPECKRIDLPPAVTAYHEREQAQRAAVAVRGSAAVADPVAEKADRARLRALKIQAEEWTEEWISTLGDPDSYDRIQWQCEAREFAAAFRGWIPEIRNAGTEDELAEIKQTITAKLIHSQPGKELRTEYDASRHRAEQAEQRRQYAEQLAEREAELEAEEEAEEAAEAERQQAEYERQQRELRKAPPPRAITPAPKPPDVMTIVAMAMEQNRKSKAERAERIERNGKCGWCRKPTPATRVYGAGYQQGGGWRGSNEFVLASDRPSTRACPKHYPQADQGAEQQNPGLKTYYWELT